MGMSLAEYADKHNQEEPPEQESAWIQTKTPAERREELEEAEQIKARISREIWNGTPPHLLLYQAVNCIELLTSDEEWADNIRKNLDDIYADISQQSLLVDSTTRELEQLQRMYEDYRYKLSKVIKGKISQLDKIRKAMAEVAEKI